MLNLKLKDKSDVNELDLFEIRNASRMMLREKRGRSAHII